jgi:hypothetical protein
MRRHAEGVKKYTEKVVGTKKHILLLINGAENILNK